MQYTKREANQTPAAQEMDFRLPIADSRLNPQIGTSPTHPTGNAKPETQNDIFGAAFHAPYGAPRDA